MVPEVGVDHDDVPRADHGLHVTVTRPPALGRGAEQPALGAGHLGLPGAQVHIVNVNMGAGAGRACNTCHTSDMRHHGDLVTNL